MVFHKLGEHGLKIELKKCQFFRPKVTYLGHMVSTDGVATDPDELAPAKDPVRPEIVSGLCILLL